MKGFRLVVGNVLKLEGWESLGRCLGAGEGSLDTMK